MKYSVIVPVYNRPDEIDELFSSLTKQSSKNFEIIVVEDGSKIDCKKVVEKYSNDLEIKYFYKENEKPAIARNYGVAHSSGEYVLFFDSDCIIPSNYFEKLDINLQKNPIDAFGGPDAASPDFNEVQKAISYSMTSLFTTGKIRGGEVIDKFYPRSFNMGIKREVFDKIGGFPVTKMHPGEDMVFAIEIIKQGYKTKLFKDCYVYHKRRNTFKSFFIQVFRFGKVRNIISKIYPETFRIFYIFPTLFVCFVLFSVVGGIIWYVLALPLAAYIIVLFFDALIKNKSLKVAFYAIYTSFLQLFGYGLGFLQPFFKNDEFGVIKNGFYKKN